jgi:NADPH:quinone reductase-like Zn-dependent oxidoreductase
LCSAVAPLDRLTLEDRDSTPCGAADVRIEITAAGVNFVDALFVQGLYQIKPPLPFVPGSEAAGRVAEVGADVTSFAVGDRVFTTGGLGGYATEMVVPLRSPDSGSSCSVRVVESASPRSTSVTLSACTSSPPRRPTTSADSHRSAAPRR